jgi:hypothetical protein
VRLVQANARSVWGTYLPVHVVVLALAVATVQVAAWMPYLVLFLAKPWLDRSLLFSLARAVFGERTRFADLWRAQRTVWWQHLLPGLVRQRLSSWRSFTAPIEQLEGQHGWSQLGARRRVLLNGQQGPARLMQLAFALLESVLWVGGAAAVAWFMPQGHAIDLAQWFDKDRDLLVDAVLALSYGVVVFVVEPYFVAAGFAMYLNRRVQLEAWDVEQEFRRVFA